jgi:transposase
MSAPKDWCRKSPVESYSPAGGCHIDKIYAPRGHDSLAPERSPRALLLQALLSGRSERQLMEQITYNMMFRWFVELSMDAPVWDVTVFT